MLNFSPLLPPLLCEHVAVEVCVGAEKHCGWAGGTWTSVVFAVGARAVCCVLTSPHLKDCVFEVALNAFSMFCESKGSLQ